MPVQRDPIRSNASNEEKREKCEESADSVLATAQMPIPAPHRGSWTGMSFHSLCTLHTDRRQLLSSPPRLANNEVHFPTLDASEGTFRRVDLATHEAQHPTQSRESKATTLSFSTSHQTALLLTLNWIKDGSTCRTSSQAEKAVCFSTLPSLNPTCAI